MPQAVALLAFGTVSTAGLTVAGISIGAGTIGGAVLSAVGGLLLSTAATALLIKTPKAGAAPEFKGIAKSAVGKRLAPIGRLQIGGTWAMEPRFSDGKMYILIAHCVGPIDGREKHIVDGQEVTIDENGFVNEDRYKHGGVSKLQILTRSGAVPSTAYQELIDAFPDWTADHRLDGLMTTLLIFTPSPSASAMFPRRADTQYSAVIRGVALEDPRTNVSVWSENVPLAIRDYLKNKFNIPVAQINDAEIMAAANLADQQRAVPGGSEALYRVGGAYALDEAPKNVLQSLLNVCDGRFTFNSDGQIGLKVGGSKTTTVKLDKRHVKGVIRWHKDGKPITQAYNVLNAKYTDQSLGFIEQSAEAFVENDEIAKLGKRKEAEADFTFSPSWTQTWRLQRDRLYKDNPIQFGTVRYDLHGLKAIGEDFIEIEVDISPTRTITAQARVANVVIPSPITHIDIDFEIINDRLYQTSLNDYGSAPALSVADENAIIDPEDAFVAAPQGVEISAGTFAAGISAAWTVDNGALLPQLEYSLTGLNSWQLVALPYGASVAQIPSLIEGAGYDLRFTWLSQSGAQSEPALITNIIATASTSTPNAPTNFSATDETGGQALISVTASNSPDNYRTNIYRNGILVADSVDSAGEVITFVDPSGVGSFVYTAVAENVSGKVSLPASTIPETTIIT